MYIGASTLQSGGGASQNPPRFVPAGRPGAPSGLKNAEKSMESYSASASSERLGSASRTMRRDAASQPLSTVLRNGCTASPESGHAVSFAPVAGSYQL